MGFEIHTCNPSAAKKKNKQRKSHLRRVLKDE
jgi:hypothetical protein